MASDDLLFDTLELNAEESVEAIESLEHPTEDTLLDLLRNELDHPDFDGGRKTVKDAIEARVEELAEDSPEPHDDSESGNDAPADPTDEGGEGSSDEDDKDDAEAEAEAEDEEEAEAEAEDEEEAEAEADPLAPEPGDEVLVVGPAGQTHEARVVEVVPPEAPSLVVELKDETQSRLRARHAAAGGPNTWRPKPSTD